MSLYSQQAVIKCLTHFYVFKKSMIHILSLNNRKIMSYMWSPNAKNMVKKDLL